MTKTYTFEGSATALAKLDSLLGLLHFMSSFGSSRRVEMAWDGDGAERIKIVSGEQTWDRKKAVEVMLATGSDIWVHAGGYEPN